MPKLTEEERERRALIRARREAVAAEEEDRRLDERRQQWERDGAYLSNAELEAGEPCGGCGEPILDQRGKIPGLMYMTRKSATSTIASRHVTSSVTVNAVPSDGTSTDHTPCTVDTAALHLP